MTENFQNKLYIHEWMAVLFFIALMFVLTISTHSCSSDSTAQSKETTPHYVTSQNIEVFVEGEVEFCGRHEIKRGAKLKDLLLLVKPKPDADLSKIKLNTLLRKGQKIKIPALKLIKILLIFPDDSKEERSFPKGTSFDELASKTGFKGRLKFLENQKGRKLKDGEVIKIDF